MWSEVSGARLRDLELITATGLLKASRPQMTNIGIFTCNLLWHGCLMGFEARSHGLGLVEVRFDHSQGLGMV
jgi:hypothetical protein